MKIFKIIAAVVVASALALMFSGVGKSLLTYIVGTQVSDVAVYGWPYDVASEIKQLAPSFKRVESFETKALFDEYLIETYGLTQKVRFVCTDVNGRSGRHSQITVAQVLDYQCPHGRMVIYKVDLP